MIYLCMYVVLCYYIYSTPVHLRVTYMYSKCLTKSIFSATVDVSVSDTKSFLDIVPE